VSCPRSIG